MRSKEEIRKKHLHLNGLSVTRSNIGAAIDKAAYDAMDEYAKEVVLAFEAWKHEYGIKPCERIHDAGKFKDGVGNVFSREELFNQFTEDQSS